MRYSQMFIPTVKEVPAEAEITSHQLMIRGGAGPQGGQRDVHVSAARLAACSRKIIEIVRQEMDRAGAQEIVVPCLQPLELWQQTGRAADYGETMFRVKDRHDRWNVLGPTAEEVFHLPRGRRDQLLQATAHQPLPDHSEVPGRIPAAVRGLALP